MRKQIILILLALLLCLTQSGCWDAEEINELGFVLGVAIDKAGDGYKVTAQIARPDIYSKSPTGGVSQNSQKPFWVISATGKTIFEAIRNMALVSPRRIFWAHIKIILIGEPLARSDIHEVLDFFTRNPELRFRTLVSVTPGEAGKLLEVAPVMEKDPATDLEKIINNQSLTGKGYRNMLKNFLESYLEPAASPVASRIMQTKVEGKPTLEFNGAAVFNKNKMVGWLNGKDTRGLLWAKGEIRDTVMVVNCPYDGQPVTIELKRGTLSVQSEIKERIPYFNVKAKATGIIVEQACTTNYNNQTALHGLEKALSAAIKSDLESAQKTSQRYGTDFDGFMGDALHRQHKTAARQLLANWPQHLRDAKFKTTVTAEIPSESLVVRPLQLNGVSLRNQP